MGQHKVSVRKDQKELLEELSYLSLSGLVRKEVDSLMDGEREYENDKRRRGTEVVKTTIQVRDDQSEFIRESGMNFSAFVGEVIDTSEVVQSL